MEGKDLQEANELIWESTLSRGLEAEGKDIASIEMYKKSADWKIRIAAELKQTTSAPVTWIAKKLNMGAPQRVSTYVKRYEYTEQKASENAKNKQM